MSAEKHDKADEENSFKQLWNDFLFAREFEYETPLTPEEMMTALRTLEKTPHNSWMLSGGKVKHELEFTEHSDKAIDLTIRIKDMNKGWWSTVFHQTEVSLRADADTGMTIIKGRTAFSSSYYLAMIALVLLNIGSQSLDGGGVGGWIWAGIFISTWFALYHERNALADRIDKIIMHAKSESSIAILDGEIIDADYGDEDLENYGQNKEYSR